MTAPINVIIADDSKVCTQLLYTILSAEPDINVIACASDGLAALLLTKKLKPDLITMDIEMPKMNGVESTRAIMEQCPTPILIISSHANNSTSNLVFNALQAGALSIIEKPPGILDEGFCKVQKNILNSVRSLSKVHVMRRKTSVSNTSIPSSFINTPLNAKIFALGSSTGGPAALRSILSLLPAGFPMPIVITQHITEGYLPGLVNWLQQDAKLSIQIAQDNQALNHGCVYFAADNAHLIIKRGETPQATLDRSTSNDLFRPAINSMFSSIAKSYPGASIGGLLTGMGEDGADGLLQMKEAGCVTFAQSENTCVIYGMPAVAVSLNAANYTLDLEKIPQFLATLYLGRKII